MSKHKMTMAVAMMVLLLCPVPGAGDAVPPGAAGCPAGTTGDSDHYGQYCSASTCKSNKDCAGGLLCQLYALCVEEEKHYHPRGNTYRLRAKGSCSKAKPCAATASCRVAKRCVPPGTPLADGTEETTPTGGGHKTPGAGAPQNQGCGSCSSGPVLPGAGGIAVALLLILALTNGRRRK